MSAARPLRVIVTRPAVQAAHWVERLGERRVAAVALPLIDIVAAVDPDGVAEAWSELATKRLVVFVSPNAAERFFAARPAGATWPDGVFAATPGPGTAQALRELGIAVDAVVEPVADADEFDSGSLWDRLRSMAWRDADVMIVRGDGGRPWLGERLADAGARVAYLSAYRRRAPTLAPADRSLIAAEQAQPASHAWLFSSSQAIDHLEQVAGIGRWSASRAIATHERIASRAHDAGFGTVARARPTLDSVVACIQSFGP